ncbi:hypothetical protein KIW84_076777 [Lathyrus oleraceus]|uniref:F-box protein n=2 Tax=Pisum sativum TaxID=3888 RepID=A0A9D4VXE8_PEA|nr:hypothetical protein KIW84_076777 [Pisum sativum]
MYFNGMCHWWGYEDYHKEEVLVSFNFSDEVFITTHTNPNYCGFVKHVMVLKDCISMIEYNNFFNLYISVLGEIGVSESWTRLFRIGPLQDFIKPIGVGKNGDIFFNRGGNIERFNLNTCMIEDIGFKGKIQSCQMVIYDNSILPIG